MLSETLRVLQSSISIHPGIHAFPPTTSTTERSYWLDGYLVLGFPSLDDLLTGDRLGDVVGIGAVGTGSIKLSDFTTSGVSILVLAS